MVFRLSEQYLIRAEAYAMKGDYGKAGKDISTLRTARYSSYGGNTSMNESNAMKIIEAERVKELYMEGFRLNDLKRWHKRTVLLGLHTRYNLLEILFLDNQRQNLQARQI